MSVTHPSHQHENQLHQELMLNTLVAEVTRVMSSSPTLENSLRSFFLGLSEITGLQKFALFQIDAKSFSLNLLSSEGVDGNLLNNLKLGLDFLSGEYPDAIFLNKHIIVDSTDSSDPFKAIGSASYVVFPIVSRITTKCWEVRKCGKVECPCYEGHNPYCWSVTGAALDTQAQSEDEKRKACVNCPVFKCEALLWMDTSSLPEGISAVAIAHTHSLCRSMGLVIESFGMYQKLKEANSKLAENNEMLSCLNNELNSAQEKIDRELDHARNIQKGLLPDSFPEHFSRGISARYIPAGKVGGDYYDFYEIDDNTCGLLIADVSGHGIAAALLMSMFKILVKTLSPTLRSPLKILNFINQAFLKETHSVNYVTVFLGFYDIKTRKLNYVNAGHTPQILLQPQGSTKELKASGIFVGILDEIMLKEETLEIPESARLIMYTDGLTETKNRNDEMYGFDRFHKHVSDTKHLSCGESLDLLLEELNEFRDSEDIMDDITLLFIDL